MSVITDQLNKEQLAAFDAGKFQHDKGEGEDDNEITVKLIFDDSNLSSGYVGYVGEEEIESQGMGYVGN